MATDQLARIKIANAIESFVNGQIDNWNLDDTIFSINTQDEMCLEIRRQLWLCYDDVKRYFNLKENALGPRPTEMLRRWQIPLRTDREWSEIQKPRPRKWWTDFWSKFVEPRLTPKCKFRNNEYWPFSDFDSWEQYRKGLPLPVQK